MINLQITNRASHLRGELKTKARPIVETFYDFESGNHRKTIAKNRSIAEDLKEGYGYAYKVSLLIIRTRSLSFFVYSISRLMIESQPTAAVSTRIL
jgi:Domain of unknown function (DUF6532)